ncbi:MAG: DUF72 domain-containing protein [Tepidisphaeraceae bacterium]
MPRGEIHWRIGTMGFSYKDWRGPFYPTTLKPAGYLSFYARQFDTAELDTTFHAIPPADRVASWAAVVPEDFRFIPKAPKAITHEPTLADKAELFGQFARSLAPMGPKLAAVLMQFPPTFGIEMKDELNGLLDRISHRLPIAVEIRHRSWFDGKSLPALQQRGVIVVANDHESRAQPVLGPSERIYVRLKGFHEAFQSYDQEQLDVTERLAWWMNQAEARVKPGGTIYVIASNDYAGFAPATVRRLRTLVGLPDLTPQPGTAEAGSLFG